MRLFTIFSIILLSIIFSSCEENKVNDLFNSNSNSVIIDNELFSYTTSENFSISNVELDNDLLKISIASSGCNGETFKTILIDANVILESLPPQRQIRLILEKNEDCEALISKTFTFDITPLKEHYSEVILNLEGWQNQIIY